MKQRLLLAAVCILALPISFSASRDNRQIGSAPFATIAFAGHTIGGEWCGGCGSGGCICDPGEVPGGNSATPVTDNKSSDQRLSPVRAHSGSGFDFGTGALVLALALLLWARLRA
ncbi:MAG TPA: hypothetical protein VN937_08715 [Blastocatellia bacterium]|nr:hypothetical protein [Blastocatellia bacterium]